MDNEVQRHLEGVQGAGQPVDLSLPGRPVQPMVLSQSPTGDRLMVGRMGQDRVVHPSAERRGIPCAYAAGEKETMKVAMWSWLVVGGMALFAAVPADGQPRAGALAVDERQGAQYGWAVDYETPVAARAAALGACGSDCSVVLTFNGCGAYAADQDADSTAVGWAESFASAAAARQAALAECRSRGGTGCIIRVWGCNGPVVEEGLNLDGAARRELQQALAAAGFDPGGADGVFSPRTRAAIRAWQSSRGLRATGYLDGTAVAALRSAGGSGTAAVVAPSGSLPAESAPGRASAAQENLFWQSVMNSTNPADFEAYLAQFPNGVFRVPAENRLAALRGPANAPPATAETRAGETGSPGAGFAGSPAPGVGAATAADAGPQPGEVFRDCDACPEMVVMPGRDVALGRYEVTVGEYRAFASATGGGGGGGCNTYGLEGSWRDPGFLQSNRHPVTCVIWDDAQAYVSWLSRMTGATYRLPTVAEWVRAAAGSRPGCGERYQLAVDRREATCAVGSYGSNSVGLSDMVGNLSEWLEDCWEGECSRRMVGGSSWDEVAEYQRPGRTGWLPADLRQGDIGFRVAREPD